MALADPTNTAADCSTCRFWRARGDTAALLAKGPEAVEDALNDSEAGWPEWEPAAERRAEHDGDYPLFIDVPRCVGLPGECRRRTPHFPAGWPVCGADDWCGEHETKATTP